MPKIKKESETLCCFIQIACSTKSIEGGGRCSIFQLKYSKDAHYLFECGLYVSELYFDAFHVLQTYILEHSFNAIIICQMKIVLKFVDSIINKVKYSQLLYAHHYRCANFSYFHAKKAYSFHIIRKILPIFLEIETIFRLSSKKREKSPSTHVKSE